MDNLNLHIEIWKKTIDVQTHFNDLELRIRNFAITILAALLTGAGLTLKDRITVSLFGHSVPVAAVLVLTALASWLAFYSMDAGWYHRLLLAAVKHGQEIEKKLADEIATIGLTTTIGTTNHDHAIGLSIRGSRIRMHFFYLGISLSLLGLSLVLILGWS